MDPIIKEYEGKYVLIHKGYQLAIKKTLSVMTKKQLSTISESSNEYEDRLERGDLE